MQMGEFCPFFKWIYQIKNKQTRLQQQCWRWCGQINGNHSRILWSCPKNQIILGTNITYMFFLKILGYKILRDVKLLYFCVLRTGLNHNLLVLLNLLIQLKEFALKCGGTTSIKWRNGLPILQRKRLLPSQDILYRTMNTCYNLQT